MRGARPRLFAAAVAAALILCNTSAPAAVDLATGIRYVIDTGTVAECGTKAQAALNAFLQGTNEVSPGDWLATGPIGATGPQTTTASGSVHCYENGKGYIVTFSCAVETPNNPYDASTLCLDIAHSFSGKPTTVLPTPSPIPTGCNTANLVGTWVSDSDNKQTLTMTPDGELTDNDGVSGNWILTGMTGTITHYGNHSITLTADGKHIRGGGISYTRKC